MALLHTHIWKSANIESHIFSGNTRWKLAYLQDVESLGTFLLLVVYTFDAVDSKSLLFFSGEIFPLYFDS